jgi:hypothetical protein
VPLSAIKTLDQDALAAVEDMCLWPIQLFDYP